MDYNNLTPEQMSAFAGQPISIDTVYRKLLKIEKDISNLLDAPVIICTDCMGTGKEICCNPDHNFMDAIGTVRLNGHANGCPCCGNDELYRIPNTICEKCNGTGKL